MNSLPRVIAQGASCPRIGLKEKSSVPSVTFPGMMRMFPDPETPEEKEEMARKIQLAIAVWDELMKKGCDPSEHPNRSLSEINDMLTEAVPSKILPAIPLQPGKFPGRSNSIARARLELVFHIPTRFDMCQRFSGVLENSPIINPKKDNAKPTLPLFTRADSPNM